MNVGMIILLIIILLLLGVIAIVFTKTYTLNEKLKKLKNTNQKVKSLSVIQDFMKVLGENLTSSSEKISKINEILIEKYEMSNVLQELWTLVARTNKYIDETRPWELAKNEETEKLSSSIYHLIENIRKIGIILLPFMEETAKNLLNQIGAPSNLQTWESLSNYDQLKDIKVIEKGEPLFMRKDMEEELEYLRS